MGHHANAEMKTVFLMLSLVVLLEAGVPVNIPCLTGATVRGTTAPPCSGSGGGGGGDCRPVGPGRCAVLYDKRDCAGWSRDVTDGEETILRWWDLSVFKYRNDIGAVSVRAGCTFQGFVTSDFSGSQCVLRAVGSDRHVNLDQTCRGFYDNIDSFTCTC